MLKRLLCLSCVLAIGAGFVAGCGGGTGSSSTAVTSVDGTKPLNTLTAVETTQLCSDTDAYMAKVVPKTNGCKLSGVMAAAFASPASNAEAQAACTTIYNQCMAAGSGTPCAPPATCTETCNPIPATCTATVAQFSACVTDTFVAYNQVLGAIPSCGAITLADLSDSTASGTTTDTTTTPPSCQTLESACPGYFSGPGGSTGMHH
jgi:hypothetical protein